MRTAGYITAITGLCGAMMLTGCGGATSSDNGDNAASAANAATAATGTGMPAGWNATDACSILDKAVVASVLKTEVKETALGLVHEANGNEAATSECTYMLTDGRATLMTRWSPIGDNTADAMKMARDTTAATMKAFSDKPVEDISGLGKSAFFVSGIKQLNVFIGENKFAIITVPGGAEGKDAAIELARKIGA